MATPDLTRYAWLSIVAAGSTIALKAVAYLVTGSVGLLSDALESLVNLVAAIVALTALRVAARPPDDEHPHGHDKAELFASGIEGALIFVASMLIVVSAVPRLLSPRALEALGPGLAVSAVASAINFAVARVLLRAGRTHASIALEADGRHLMTDVWTSVGVVAGVALVWATGVKQLDPLVALVVAAHISWTGYGLVRRSIAALMDPQLPDEERRTLERTLDSVKDDGATWHALKTRQSGKRRFASVHVLVPGTWSVARAHDLAEQLEQRAAAVLDPIELVVHLEPLEDPRAWGDEGPSEGRATGAPPRAEAP